jgi:hypothetical protein
MAGESNEAGSSEDTHHASIKKKSADSALRGGGQENKKRKRKEHPSSSVYHKKETEAIVSFVHSRGEDSRPLWKISLATSRDWPIGDDVSLEYMPGWRRGAQWNKLKELNFCREASPLLHRLEGVDKNQENSNARLIQRGSESTQLLLDCFTLQRNIRSLAFAVVIHGLSMIAKNDNGSNTRDERKESDSDLAPVEHVVAAQCSKLARQCSTLLASAPLSLFDNNDSISILQEKSKALALATQRWKDLSNSKQSKKYSLCSLFEPRMKVLMAADDLYYRLYYEQLVAFTPPTHFSHHPQLVGVTNKNKKQTETIVMAVPHPHVYFSLPGLSWLCPPGMRQTGGANGIDDPTQLLDPLALLHEKRLDETRLHFQATGWNITNEATNGHWKAVQGHRRKHHKLQNKKRSTLTTEQWLDLNETPAHSLLSAWRDSIRDFPTHLYGYATLPAESYKRMIDVTRTYLSSNQEKSPTFIEMGAGTGYLAHCLKHAGGIVSAYDSSPLPFLSKRSSETNHTNTKRSNSPKNSSNNEYHGSTPSFFPVQRGSPATLSNTLDPTKGGSPSSALLLCYPPPGDDMGENAVRAYLKHHNSGGIVIHIGEFFGLTGSAGLEHLLLDEFECLDRWNCLHWGTDGASTVTIWKQINIKDTKKGATVISPRMLTPCLHCRKHEAEKRCVFARDFAYCGMPCFQLHEKERDTVLHNTYILSLTARRNEQQKECGSMDFSDPSHFQNLDKVK